MKQILALQELSVAYGAVEAVRSLTLEVKQGQVVALLGANGAGKSSCLRAICGWLKPRQGDILYKGSSIAHLPEDKIARLGLAHVPEGRQIFVTLSVKENLEVGAYTLKTKQEYLINLERCFQCFPILRERQEQLAGTLSGGEQQMLAIARGLMSSPELLLLDEPSLGLAPLIVKDILGIVRQIADAGTTVLIVEQNSSQTLKIADYAYVLAVGRLVGQGTSLELANDPRLKEAYLGRT